MFFCSPFWTSIEKMTHHEATKLSTTAAYVEPGKVNVINVSGNSKGLRKNFLCKIHFAIIHNFNINFNVFKFQCVSAKLHLNKRSLNNQNSFQQTTNESNSIKQTFTRSALAELHLNVQNFISMHSIG